ncbi:transcription initiation factor TFIID subunit 1-like isoform X6 [Vicia villosa]|uniref:transcription initiation factor TFIID subunit 1-like isoform X6 n=1 Tax=Vicia villosa TaxID=3911 RepID=UPI00273A76FE|nr:transcription initiation factor TFIID subunit 1-like isoform X6 [Vicia villosa]
MQDGLYRLKHLGITETHPNNISSAMSRLPDEDIALAAASHIERELQITPWNLSSNFAACTTQVLLKFNVPEEVIAKQTRWHRIAMIRKLSSEQAVSVVKVDPTTIGKYARGQRMSFLQLQQQTREKCQEIWNRQVQSLSALNGDDNESDSEGNSDLDSFAGDLENLLDAEEFEEGEEGTIDLKRDKGDSVKGLKMRRRTTLAQAEEEIEDEAAEAAELCRLLMDDDGAYRKKKKNARVMVDARRLIPKLQPKFVFDSTEQVKLTNTTLQLDGTNHFKVDAITDHREDDKFSAKKSKSVKVNKAKKSDISPISVSNKKIKLNMGEGIKIVKLKKKVFVNDHLTACHYKKLLAIMLNFMLRSAEFLNGETCFSFLKQWLELFTSG